MANVAVASGRSEGMTKEERRVIFASSLGTVFEWYDFYLYATLAPFFAALFFPPGNDTAALLSAFATYAAGFLVRPFGAIIFGRIGDLVGRKSRSLSRSWSWARPPSWLACSRRSTPSGGSRRSCS
jgi:MFS family permease